MAFSQDIADKVCEALSLGMSLRKASQQAGTSAQSVLRWKDADSSFSEQYTRARMYGYELRADSLMDTACDESIEPASRRIIVDTQKWELSKMLPKVYGDKLELGGDITVRSLPAELAALNGRK